MNFISKIIPFLLIGIRCFAQDEIIERKTKSNIGGNLKVLRMSDDSLYYSLDSINKSILIKNVIAYKKQSKGVYFFPFDVDKETFIILKGKAHYKTNLAPYYRQLMTYYLDKTPLHDNLYEKPTPLLIQHKTQNKSIALKHKRRLYFIIKTSQSDFYLETRRYVLIDSVMHVKHKFSRKDSAYYAFPLSAIKKMGVQTKGTITARYTFGVLSILIAGLPGLIMPSIISFSPIYRKVDVVSNWNIKPL